MPEKFSTNQQEYWNKQHKNREHEFYELEQKPNEFAKNCLRHIKPGSKILEVGVANGRDARYFVRENQNIIVGVDISTEAIRQLVAAAIKDKTIDNILPIVAAANEIPELLKDQEYYDAFYARSALHLDNDQLISFLRYLVSHLNKDGIIMIQGKLKDDFKIKRSLEVGKNYYEDADGHIRRVWSNQDIELFCDMFGLEIIEIGNTVEVWQGKETKFIHFIAQKKQGNDQK